MEVWSRVSERNAEVAFGLLDFTGFLSFPLGMQKELITLGTAILGMSLVL